MIPKMHYGVIVDVDEKGTKVPNADMKKNAVNVGVV